MRKKYYSISEAAIITGFSENQLRYLEKNIPRFYVYKIRNRRYYSVKNLERLANIYKLNLNYASIKISQTETKKALIASIDDLLQKFRNLMIFCEKSIHYILF